MDPDGRKDHEPQRRTGHDPDEIDRLVDEVLARPHAGDAEDRDDVVAALERVRGMAAEPMPPASRARHLAAIRSADPKRSLVRRPLTGRRLRLQRRLAPITAVAVALALFAGSGTAAVAQAADPDDALYPVKRSTEQVWLALPRGSERAADVHLALAERRINEAQRAPHHAEDLLAAGLSSIEAASDERPEEALANFARLLGAGEDALPEQASPRARSALYRNCIRIAEQHGLDHACPEPTDLDEHPGHGRGAGPPGGPRGWGPGGRPEGHVGPPPGVPAHERGNPGQEEDD